MPGMLIADLLSQNGFLPSGNKKPAISSCIIRRTFAFLKECHPTGWVIDPKVEYRRMGPVSEPAGYG